MPTITSRTNGIRAKQAERICATVDESQPGPYILTHEPSGASLTAYRIEWPRSGVYFHAPRGWWMCAPLGNLPPTYSEVSPADGSHPTRGYHWPDLKALGWTYRPT